MRQWLRSHLTYANVMSTLAVFLVLGGGTALGAYVVSSNSQIGPGTVSGHTPPTGKHANVIAGSINGGDIADNSLKGANIADRSGVDTCPSGTTRFGPICAGSDGTERSFDDAINYCADLGLRLPVVLGGGRAGGGTTTFRGSVSPSSSGPMRSSFTTTAFGTQSSLMKTELDTRPLKMSSRRT